MPIKKKSPGRPKQDKTVVVGFRITEKDYKWLNKNIGKPEQVAKNYLESLIK